MTTICQMPLRLKRDLYDKIRAEAKDRGVSMNAIVRESLEGRTQASPVNIDSIREIVMTVLKEDAAIIEALKARSKTPA
jgi:hypothetical protein